MKCLGIAVFALLALETIGPAAHAEDAWSTPTVTLRTFEDGSVQRVESARRNFKDSSATRNLEARLTAELEQKGATGRYTLTRKQIYKDGRLVTFYRKLDAQLGSSRPLRFSEQSQLSKSGGRFNGTLIREFSPGDPAEQPSVRFIVHFEHFMLATGFFVKVFTRAPGSVWRLSATAEGETMEAAFSSLGKKLAKRELSAPEKSARFFTGLWSRTLAQGPLDIAQLLYPLLTPGGKSFIDGKTDVRALARLSAQALERSGERGAELAQWRGAENALERSRQALEKSIRRRDSSLLKRSADEYTRHAQSIMTAPSARAPSLIEALQASLVWIADAHESLGHADVVGDLPARWAKSYAASSADVYYRSLYLLLLARETTELQQLADRAAAIPEMAAHWESMRRTQISLIDAARSWRTVASTRPDWKTRLTLWLDDPWRGLVAEAHAAGADGASYTEQLYGFPGNPLRTPPHFTFAVGGDEIPTEIDEAVASGYMASGIVTRLSFQAYSSPAHRAAAAPVPVRLPTKEEYSGLKLQ